jgi:hypothetical protein
MRATAGGCVADEPFARLPDDVTVTLAEVTAVIEGLEDVLDALHHSSIDHATADLLDAAIGRMTRWGWPLLGELDARDGYDD